MTMLKTMRFKLKRLIKSRRRIKNTFTRVIKSRCSKYIHNTHNKILILNLFKQVLLDKIEDGLSNQHKSGSGVYNINKDK